ncbi:hypothetical protein ABZ923_37300 [Streptomyces sp. NPDC046881]|uniref:hypothetical protein n=1 Tax=Streptomyces sp. NPDC046881 TaxID=3155374 RepID=UPI0033F880E4
MPRSSRPHGQAPPVRDQVNQLIRRLMNKPADKKRTAEYERLLVLWSEATQPEDVEKAA